jgi:hypothetical protein
MVAVPQIVEVPADGRFGHLKVFPQGPKGDDPSCLEELLNLIEALGPVHPITVGEGS